MAQPEPQFIAEYKTHLQGVWSDAHNHWRSVIDPWYWGEANVWPPELAALRSKMQPSTARNKIEHAADVLLAFEPRFYRNPVGKGRKHEKDADDIEAGLGAVFFDSMLYEDSLAFKAAGKYAGAYGYAVLEGPVTDMSGRPTEPERKKGESDEHFRWRMVDYRNSQKSWNPFRITAPHPAHVLLDPQKRRPDDGIKMRRIFVKDVQSLLESLRKRDKEHEPLYVATDGELPLSGGTNPFAEVAGLEYWSRDYHALTIGNQMVFVEENEYGFCPFNHFFTGFGMEQTGQPNINPRWLAQGLIDAILDSLRVQAQSFSAKHTVMLERAYPRRRVGSGADPAEITEQLATPDGVIQADAEDFGFILYPEVERGLAEIDRSVTTDIDEGTFSTVVSGGRVTGVDTVGQHAMQVTSATKKFAIINKNLNLAGTIIGQNILKCVDRMAEVIQVGGERLDPKQIHEDYIVTAEFTTFDPVLQLQERETSMREFQMGLIDAETYRERTQIANESEVKKRLLKEKVRSGPAYLKAMEKVVQEEDGMREIVEKMEAEAQAAAQGPDVPASMPDSPQGSPQTLAGATDSMRQALGPDTVRPPLAGMGVS